MRKYLKIQKGYLEAVHRRTDKAVVKRKMDKYTNDLENATQKS